MKKKLGTCPVCDSRMERTGKNEITHHHLFFPKKDYAENENLKLVICRECHNLFNEMVKNISKPTKPDCVALFVIFCKGKGKMAYAIYKDLKRVAL